MVVLSWALLFALGSSAAGASDEPDARPLPRSWLDAVPPWVKLEPVRYQVDVKPREIQLGGGRLLRIHGVSRPLRVVMPEGPGSLLSLREALTVRLYLRKEGDRFAVTGAWALTSDDLAGMLADLGHSSFRRRERATGILARVAAPMKGDLDALLYHADAEVRYRARHILEAPSRLVRDLIAAVDTGRVGALPEMSESYQSVLAMGEAAIDPLMAALEQSLSGRQGGRSWLVLRLLHDIGSPLASDALCALLARADGWSVDRAFGYAVYELRHSGTAAKLVYTLSEGSPRARVNAATVLSFFGSSVQVEEALKKAARAKDGELRLAALDSLRHLRASSADDLFIQGLSDATPGVREVCARAAGVLSLRAAIPGLISMLKSEGRDADAAADALARLRAPESVAPLIEISRGEDEKLQRKGIRLLGRLRAEAAVDALVEIVRAEAGPKDSALLALGRIGTPDVLPVLLSSLAASDANAIRALGMVRHPGAAEALCQMLPTAPGAGLRVEILRALDEVADPACAKAVIAFLEEVASEGQADGQEVLATGCRLLGTLDVPEGLELLATLARDMEGLRRPVLEALLHVRDPRAVEVIRPFLEDGSPEVRQRAAYALSQHGVLEGMDAVLLASIEDVRRARPIEVSSVLTGLGIDYLYARQLDHARRIFKTLLEVNPDDFISLYNLACTNSLAGRSDEALDYLDAAILTGITARDATFYLHMRQDKDLDPIRSLPRYGEIVAPADPPLLEVRGEK